MIELFDAWAGFGGGEPGVREQVTAEDLAAEMDRASIARALVRTAPEQPHRDLGDANARLLAACAAAGAGRLIPCGVVVPDTGGDLPSPAQQIDALLADGPAAACIRPEMDGWVLADWVADGLLAALAERRVPVFCRPDHVPLTDVGEIARRHPGLPIVVADVGYRSLRILRPLMRTFANVHVSTGGAFSVPRGIEYLLDAGSAERVLFGTGFPASEPMAAVAQLAYAEIDASARADVASGNLDRLLGGTVR